MTARQSSFASESRFDAQNRKLPSKVSSALRCSFHNTLNSKYGFPVTPGNLGKHPGSSLWDISQNITATSFRALMPLALTPLNPDSNIVRKVQAPPIGRWGNLGSMRLKNLGAVKGATGKCRIMSKIKQIFIYVATSQTYWRAFAHGLEMHSLASVCFEIMSEIFLWGGRRLLRAPCPANNYVWNNLSGGCFL